MRVFPAAFPSLIAASFLSLAGAAHAGKAPADAGFDPPTPLYEVDLSKSGGSRKDLSEFDLLSVRPGLSALVLGSPGTKERLEEAGFCFTLVDPDYGRTLALREPFARGTRPQNAFQSASEWNIPPLGQGSIAGWWNLDEVYALIDSLVASDSLGIVTGIDTIGTSLQGRPILAFGIFDGSQPEGTRPQALLTGLHHAREPGSMHVVLRFAQELLSQYGTDPELTYLVDERETWFVPCVNPDGYVRNENTWINQGTYGFWRKNLRDNNGSGTITSQDGVDLNRNYGYQWGYDNQGSSPTWSSETYRGTSAFSEPETQAIRDFVLGKTFRTACNYHTFFEACLYPWGYTASGTPDEAAYIRLGDSMAENARYAYGSGEQILYLVNGEANDWMYGEQGTKPKVFALTTEVGNQDDGFWPPASRVVPISELHLEANKILVYSAGVYLTSDSLTLSGNLDPGATRDASFRLRNQGVWGSTSGGITATLTSGHPDVSVLDDQAAFPDLGPSATSSSLGGDVFTLVADPDLVNGTLVPLFLDFTSGDGYVGRDTLCMRAGTPEVVFSDDASGGLLDWTATGGWGIDTVATNLAFSDSPGGDYPGNANSRLTLAAGLDLSGAVNAVMRFETLWNIEGGYDFALVEVSTNAGASWTALPGRHTRPGHGTTNGYQNGKQTLGVPGYDMNQRFWQEDEIDLGAFAGQTDLRLRFRLASDSELEMDGWLIDDIEVFAYAPIAPLAAERNETSPAAIRLAATPNPVRLGTTIRFELGDTSPVRLSVYDISGRRVRTLSQGMAEAGERSVFWDGRGASGQPVAVGTYFIRLETPGGTKTTKVSVIH